MGVIWPGQEGAISLRKDSLDSGAETKPQMGRLGRVIADYRSAYRRPWVMRAGEQLSIGQRQSEWDGWIWCANQRGQARWVPEKYVQRKGDSCVALCDYQAAELSVSVGEELIIDSEESGWIWCTNRQGRSGWVPAANVEILPE